MRFSRISNDTTTLRERAGRDIIDYRHLIDCLGSLRKPRDRIRRMLSRGEIVRVKKGLYVFAEPYRRARIRREQLANLIYGPSYISLDYALFYHGLIPQRVETVTSVCVGRTRRFDTPFGAFTYRSLAMARYSTGAELHGVPEAPFLMAGPAKALVDKVWADSRPIGTSSMDYSTYLVEDLRIDREHLISLESHDLTAAAKAYGSAKIDRLVRFILGMKE